MVQLPKFVALKSKYNHKYLRYVNETCSPVRTFLQYSKNEVLTPYTRFELEQAECDPCLFHIKCCYNNKYWVSWDRDHHFIVAGSDQKEEDRSKWTCTLFRPVYDSCHQSFRFCHVNLGLNIVLWRVGPPQGECLRAQWSVPDKDLCDLSTVIDLESMWLLPKYLAFKCDIGSYLTAHSMDQLPYLQFSSKSIDVPTIMETFTANDGRIRVKSNHFQKFWRRGTSNWIFADSTDTDVENPDTSFLPTKVSSNVVALRDMGNDSFIKRYTLGSKTSCLNAAAKEIDQYSHLQMFEPVLSRDINNVAFYLSEAGIYDQVGIVLATAEAINMSKVPKTVCMTVSYENTRSSTWCSSVSTKLDVKTKIKSKFLDIVDGNVIETSPTEFAGEYKWGETRTTSSSEKKAYNVTIPPMSIAIGKLCATKGSCVAPFSYRQADILVGGKKVEYCLDDGVFRGTNYYNFKFETKTKPIGECATK